MPPAIIAAYSAALSLLYALVVLVAPTIAATAGMVYICALVGPACSHRRRHGRWL